MKTIRYCPNCKSQKPMAKAGMGPAKGNKFVQRWRCVNCGKHTVKPLSTRD